MEVDRDREGSVSGGDPNGGPIPSKRRGKSFLLPTCSFRGEMATACAASGPGFNAVQPIDVEGGGHYDSGKRKERGERNGEMKQHGEGGRKTFSE